MRGQKVLVEIVAKKKGCMMCDLAIAILEEITPEFDPGILQWLVVDVGSREGVARHAELGSICGRMPAVPSIVINEAIAFDNIPDMDSLTVAVQEASYSDHWNLSGNRERGMKIFAGNWDERMEYGVKFYGSS